MEFVRDDGGRDAAGYKGTTGDCACRAIAIATGLPYQFVYDHMNKTAKEMPLTRKMIKRKDNHGSARTGVTRDVYQAILEELGWIWVPTMGIGTGCQTHMRADELPAGNIIVRLSGHVAAVIDGVLHDTYDCTRNGTRCVYGYFRERFPQHED